MRWLRSALAILNGARLHPSSRLLGRQSQFQLNEGCKLADGVTLDACADGRIVIGKRVWIAHDVEMQTESLIRLGEGTTVQRRSSINGTVDIGRSCILAPSVFISSGSHPFRWAPHLDIREQEALIARDPDLLMTMDRAVKIQDDCWLGTHVVVCPGVTIEKGSVIGANAVVTRDVPPYSVYAGQPARRIGMRLDWSPPTQLNPERPEDRPYFLEAKFENLNTRHVIRISPDHPFEAAMARVSTEQVICVNFMSHQNEKLEANGSQIDILQGKHQVCIKPNQLQWRSDHVRISLKLHHSAVTNHYLYIESLCIKLPEYIAAQP